MGSSLRDLKSQFQAEATSLSILVVDDYEAIRDSSIMLLNVMGFQNTYDACDGRTALEVLRNHKIDLVLSDINMPVMNGFEMMRAIRAEANLSHIPVIAISGRDDNEAEAIRSGATLFLVKGANNFEQVMAFIQKMPTSSAPLSVVQNNSGTEFRASAP